ncbi:hypothetical protein V8E55_008575 [Tylopilus felleus]
MQLKVLCSHLIPLLPLFLGSLAQAQPVYGLVHRENVGSSRDIDRRDAREDYHKRLDTGKRETDMNPDWSG